MSNESKPQKKEPAPNANANPPKKPIRMNTILQNYNEQPIYPAK
jgi:hypothetical protein